MNLNIPKTAFLLLLAAGFFNTTSALANCPGCMIQLPNLSEDTFYVDSIPAGEWGQNYQEDISFRLPKTTNGVPGQPPGLNIKEIRILGITYLPAGLSWEANQTVFDPEEETDGCMRICGQPLEHGWFSIEVNIEADVFLFTTTTTVTLDMYIAPPSATTQGFTMTNNSGCGQAIVSFQNNQPSNGHPDFFYTWDFGNGNISHKENPADQLYNQPGKYPVHYRLVVDSVGHLLTLVTVKDVACGDIFDKPDLQLKIFDPQGAEIYSSDVRRNQNPPVFFSLFLEIDTGDYELQVWDDDDILGGGDDFCGSLTFNQKDNGNHKAGDLEVELNILHITSTFESVDTVYVYEEPGQPAISAPDSLVQICVGDSVMLTVDVEENIHWYLDGAPIFQAENDTLFASLGGEYSVKYVDPNGCVVFSDTQMVNLLDLPPEPVYKASGNLLTLDANIDLPVDHLLQWYYEGEVLPGENGKRLCIDTSGRYTLEILDTQTGCINTFTANMIYDPDVACFTPVKVRPGLESIELYPNPVQQVLYAENLQGSVDYQLMGVLGNLLRQGRLEPASGRAELELSGLSSGIYWLRLHFEGQHQAFKIIKQ